MRSIFTIISIFLCILLFSACEQDEVPSEQTHPDYNAALELYMTDAPGPYEKVLLDIKKVEVRIDTANSQNAQAGIWQELPIVHSDFNLLSLRNGRDTLLASGAVFAGTLKEIRLTFGDDNTVVLKNEQHYNMIVPESVHSLAKLLLEPFARTANPGKGQELVLDFDVMKSIIPLPDPQDSSNTLYQFNPYTRTFPKKAGGAIEGWVFPIDAEPTVVAISNHQDTISTQPDTNGYFKLWGLPKGNYTVKYIPKSTTNFNEKIKDNIQITAGNLATSDTVRLGQ